MHGGEQVRHQRAVAVFVHAQAQFALESCEPMPVEAGGHALQRRGGAFDRLPFVGIDQRQQRFGEPGEIPLQDARLVAGQPSPDPLTIEGVGMVNAGRPQIA